MIGKTIVPAKMRLQADNKAELEAMIEAAEGFVLDGKIYKISGVFYANLIEEDYALPIYQAPEDEEEEEVVTLTAEEAALYNAKKPLTGEAALKEGDPKPEDYDAVVNA